MMMKGNGKLDQSLQELFLLNWRASPNIFQDFMSLEELSSIEQLHPTPKFLVAYLLHLPNIG